jgi:hypothetical protein
VPTTDDIEAMKNRTPEDRRLLQMLKWLVGFHQPGDAKAVIDAEPINQARRLIARIESPKKAKNNV